MDQEQPELTHKNTWKDGVSKAVFNNLYGTEHLVTEYITCWKIMSIPCLIHVCIRNTSLPARKLQARILRALATVECDACYLWKSCALYHQMLLSWLAYFAVARYADLETSCTICICCILSFALPKANDLNLSMKVKFDSAWNTAERKAAVSCALVYTSKIRKSTSIWQHIVYWYHYTQGRLHSLQVL